MKIPKLIAGSYRDERLLFRMVGNAIGNMLAKTSISANQLTIFRILCVIPVYYLFTVATPEAYLLAGILHIILRPLDFADGHLARITKNETKLGYWMENTLDYIILSHYSIWGFFIALGIYLRSDSVLIWIILFLNLHAGYANDTIVKTEKAISDGERSVAKKSGVMHSINNGVMFFMMWSDLLINCSAILYGTLITIGIDPIYISFGLVAIVHQSRWIGRIILGFKTYISYEQE